ncbi:ParA family protein [Corallococcus interemptor]|uniref:ParA family protein n=1 Tax=Corallococcus interemptor TaxID=2316720 RepID=UPI003CFC56C3
MSTYTASPSLLKNKAKAKNHLSEIKGRGPQAICFFNNKGGVGKTTLVANLAAQMSLELGCKLLVVDADPQCNLTQYMLTDDEFIDTYDQEPASIYSIIHPLSIGRGYSEKLPIRAVQKFGCDIVIGDPRLALKEDLLAQDWRDAKAGGTRGLRTTFVFSDLFKKAKNYDFVFIDMGPSLGAINRAILLSADFFVVPMSIDIFSLWAIKNIGEAVKIWRKELENGIELAEDPSEIPHLGKLNHIRFLGYVTQQHKERTKAGSRRIVEAYDAINRRLPAEIEDKLSTLYSSKDIEPHLGDIKHLASLAPKSQTLHAPMINVSLKGSYTTLRKQAREIYGGISAQFLENLSSTLSSTKR